MGIRQVRPPLPGQHEQSPPAVPLIGLADHQPLLHRPSHQPARPRLIHPEHDPHLADGPGPAQFLQRVQHPEHGLIPWRGQSAQSPRPQVDDLIRRGWVSEVEGGPAVRLTTAGRAAHHRVAERVRAFRARVTEGLSEQEYATLVTLLERVAGNLTPA